MVYGANGRIGLHVRSRARTAFSFVTDGVTARVRIMEDVIVLDSTPVVHYVTPISVQVMNLTRSLTLRLR